MLRRTQLFGQVSISFTGYRFKACCIRLFEFGAQAQCRKSREHWDKFLKQGRKSWGLRNWTVICHVIQDLQHHWHKVSAQLPLALASFRDMNFIVAKQLQGTALAPAARGWICGDLHAILAQSAQFEQNWITNSVAASLPSADKLGHHVLFSNVYCRPVSIYL